MKKLLFIAAMLLMVSSASAQKKADSKTVYIIDGKVQTEEFFKIIPPELIENIEIKKGVKSVVNVTTKEYAISVDEDGVETVIVGFGESKKETVWQHVDRTNPQQGRDKIVTIRGDVDPKDVSLDKLNVDGALYLGKANPTILVIDEKGKAEKVKNLDHIKASDIESLTIVKTKEEMKPYVEKYGPSDEGFVVVTIKKSK